MQCTDHAGFSAVARDHARNPRHYGPIESFNGHARITGPCGDTMEFWVSARRATVEQVSFITDGCGSSAACGSMACALALHKRVEEVATLTQKDVLDALGGFPEDSAHCALLAANTLRAACEDHLKRPNEDAAESARAENENVEERRRLQARMGQIRHKIIVMSGKGGVGKSTVAVNLAMALVLAGKRVGLLDVDIHGPSIPTLLGLEREMPQGCEDGLLPVKLGPLQVMSLGFLLRNPDDAVIWRGPMKAGVIKQFLQDVRWGDLDYLIIDSPPGTGDEPLSVCQLIESLDGAVIVTTPQKLAAADVRKSITFCRQLGVRVLGVVENMSGFACPKCGEVTEILSAGGGRRIAEDMHVPFLGAIPMDPKLAETCDTGRPFVQQYSETPTAQIIRSIFDRITATDEQTSTISTAKDKPMRIAIPTADGKLSMHFGHCERFALIDVDPTTRTIVTRSEVEAPPHEPGLLPVWLAERGAGMIIAGGMGQRAQALFTERGIRVLVGAPAEAPETIVNAYLAGTLATGANSCDH